MSKDSEALRRKAKKRAKTPWQLARHAVIVNAEEVTYVYKRAEGKNHLGTPVGYVVQVFTGCGSEWGWTAHVFTDHARRDQGNRPVGARDSGNGARKRCATAVWGARVIEPRYPEVAVDYHRAHGYGCGAKSRSFRAAVVMELGS